MGSEVVVMLCLFVHVFFICYLRFSNVEYLPFSGFKMFSDLKDLFDPKYRKWFWLTDKPHQTGTLKNYSYPFCRNGVRADELHKLDYKYLLVGHSGPASICSTGKASSMPTASP